MRFSLSLATSEKILAVSVTCMKANYLNVEFEYFGEFEILFENSLGDQSGRQEWLNNIFVNKVKNVQTFGTILLYCMYYENCLIR